METPLPSLSQLTPNLTSAAAASTAIPAAVKSIAVPQPIDGSSLAVGVDTGGNTEPLPAVPGAKLRLMCSFGGHIMPRPHDKALTYSGGETRLVVVDRRSSLSSLRSRLSSMLLNGRSFSLKYQLPSEDLDSLVTITTDEDLENMIEEYDRATSSATATATQRIRLFLFANKLETAATMGSLLDGAKSDSWFVDALNQSGLLPRGLSDSAAVNNTLVNLDEASGGEKEIQNVESNGGGCEINKRGDLFSNGVISHQEMQMSSMPDSPMVDAAESSSLPQIRATEDQRIEEHLAQMNFSRHFEDGNGLMANRPTMIPISDPAMAYNNAPSDAAATSNGHVSQEDDRSDPGVSNGYRKPPLPMQPVAIPPRAGGGYGLVSPDSVASDTSISSATSFSKLTYYQEQPPPLPRAPITQPETTSIQTSQVRPQPETTSHVLPQPGTYTTMDQHHQPLPPQPFIHQGIQYIPNPSQFLPGYPHHQHPGYMLPVMQSQQYPPAGTRPPFMNSKPAPTPRPESNNQNVYPAMPQNPPPQVPHQQLQHHQFIGYTGAPHPQHAPNANANYGNGVPQQSANANGNYGTGFPQQSTNANYGTGVPQHNANANYGGGYEYTNPPNETAYYHHAQPPPLAPQYQTMTPAAAAAALADVSNQMGLEGGNQQQRMAASQPL